MEIIALVVFAFATFSVGYAFGFLNVKSREKQLEIEVVWLKSLLNLARNDKAGNFREKYKDN